jgi:hypothetical protein
VFVADVEPAAGDRLVDAISALGVITSSSILIVSAMAVSPDLLPICATAGVAAMLSFETRAGAASAWRSR